MYYTIHLNVFFLGVESAPYIRHHHRMKSPAREQQNDKRSEISTALGKSLKAHRIACGITQEALAYAVKVERTYISNIERGMGNPSIQALGHICHSLQISLADLFAPLDTVLDPGNRRANHAKPRLKEPKSRLR